jgi:hypothetical protein
MFHFGAYPGEKLNVGGVTDIQDISELFYVLLLHLQPQTQWACVCPNFLDVRQALLLGVALAFIFSRGVFVMCRPNGILLFMILR